MHTDLDWSQRGEYIHGKHKVTVAQATEAVRDPLRVVIMPDYNSLSGRTVRIIGYSRSAGELLTILAIENEGVEYGVNGWVSNKRDRNIYREEAVG